MVLIRKETRNDTGCITKNGTYKKQQALPDRPTNFKQGEPMNLNFLCCIGAELKNSTQQTTRMTQVYLYRAFETETVDDMLSPGFFNAALGILRLDDLLLLYGPNDSRARYVYARVSEITRNGVVIEKVNIDARAIYVNTDDMSNLHKHTLQEVIEEIDAEITRLDDRIDEEIERAKAAETALENDAVKKSDTEMQTISGALSVTDEICLIDPADNTAKHSLAIVGGIPTETATEMDVIGNRKYDTLPTTDDTTAYDDLNPKKMITKGQVAPVLTALNEKVDLAATSGTLVGSYWFGKTDASAEVPAPTLPGQNYYDFTTGQVYKSTDGETWALDTTYTPPTDKDVQIGITSKFWDIAEQENQHGGVAKWSHTDADWAYYPQMYESKPAGASLPILTRMISDHQLNDVSYLNANTFSWQSGAVYVAAYQHLVDDLAAAGAVQTVSIEGITISYKVATDGQRICTPDQETAISQLYDKTGEANFYILDTENAQFKLPRTQKRKLIRAVKNDDGSWYNLYSDGWVEQGGRWVGSKECGEGQETVVMLTLPVPMQNLNYYADASVLDLYLFSMRQIRTDTTVQFGFGAYKVGRTLSKFVWQVKGYAADSVLANEPVQYEYYYVGNFERSAIEQTAGLNAELFNNKADLNLMNTASNVDFVVESQVPTNANGYTWYRKYKSGWVEQGGRETSGAGTKRVNLLVPMATNNYTAFITTQSGSNPSYSPAINAISSTAIDLLKPNTVCFWEVKGMAA